MTSNSSPSNPTNTKSNKSSKHYSSSHTNQQKSQETGESTYLLETGRGTIIRRIPPECVANRVIRIIDGQNSCCAPPSNPQPVPPPSCPPCIPPPCSLTPSYIPCHVPPYPMACPCPPPYCFPIRQMRPRFFGPPVLSPLPPPPPVIIMPPSHPASHGCVWRCPASSNGIRPLIFPSSQLPPPRMIENPAQSEKYPYYNNCNFYGPDFKKTISPDNESPCCYDSMCSNFETSRSPSRTQGFSKYLAPAHDDCILSKCERNRITTENTAITSNGWGGNHARYHRDPQCEDSQLSRYGSRTPFSCTAKRRRCQPNSSPSNDSINFTIDQGEILRARIPRTIRIEAIEPESRPPSPPPHLASRRHGRRSHRRHRKHNCRKLKQGINNSCKKCIQKFIDDQVCRRLEEMCLPDPSCCEPVENMTRNNLGIEISTPNITVAVNTEPKVVHEHRNELRRNKSILEQNGPVYPHLQYLHRPSSPSPSVIIRRSTTLPPRPLPEESRLNKSITEQSGPFVYAHRSSSRIPSLLVRRSTILPPRALPEESRLNKSITEQSGPFVYAHRSSSRIPSLLVRRSTILPPRALPEESRLNKSITKQNAPLVYAHRFPSPNSSIMIRLSTILPPRPLPQESRFHLGSEAPGNQDNSRYTTKPSMIRIETSNTRIEPLKTRIEINPDSNTKINIEKTNKTDVPKSYPRQEMNGVASELKINKRHTLINVESYHPQNDNDIPRHEHECEPHTKIACVSVPDPCSTCVPPEPKYMLRPSFCKVDRVVITKNSLENLRQRHVTVFRHHVPHSIIPNPNYIQEEMTNKPHPERTVHLVQPTISNIAPAFQTQAPPTPSKTTIRLSSSRRSLRPSRDTMVPAPSMAIKNKTRTSHPSNVTLYLTKSNHFDDNARIKNSSIVESQEEAQFDNHNVQITIHNKDTDPHLQRNQLASTSTTWKHNANNVHSTVHFTEADGTGARSSRGGRYSGASQTHQGIIHGSMVPVKSQTSTQTTNVKIMVPPAPDVFDEELTSILIIPSKYGIPERNTVHVHQPHQQEQLVNPHGEEVTSMGLRISQYSNPTIQHGHNHYK